MGRLWLIRLTPTLTVLQGNPSSNQPIVLLIFITVRGKSLSLGAAIQLLEHRHARCRVSSGTLHFVQDLSTFHRPVGTIFNPQLNRNRGCFRLSDDQVSFFREHGYITGLRVLIDERRSLGWFTDGNLWVAVALHICMNLWWELFSVAKTAIGGWFPFMLQNLTMLLAIFIILYRTRSRVAAATPAT